MFPHGSSADEDMEAMSGIANADMTSGSGIVL